MTEITYPTKLVAETQMAYDEAAVFIGGMSQSQKAINGITHYYLDKEKTKEIITNRNFRTIDLSDKIGSDIIGLIEHILKTEKRGENSSFSNIFRG